MKASLELLLGSDRKVKTETNTDGDETESDYQDSPKILNSCHHCHRVFNWDFVKITERCPHCDESLTDEADDEDPADIEAHLDDIFKDRIESGEDDEPF